MVKKRLTHAGIYETRSVGVYSNGVFAEFLRFKSLSQSTNKDIGSMNDIPAACVRPRTANLDAEYPATMLAPALVT